MSRNRILLVALCCFLGVAAAEVFDKVVAVVGNKVITAGEIDQQLRLEAFLNQQPVDGSRQSRVRALERLIDQSLISQEMLVNSFLGVSEEKIEQELDALRKQHFSGGMKFDAALKAYHLSEEDLKDFLRRQMNVLRFIDFRFRTGLQVSEAEIQAYYKNQYAPEVRRVEKREPKPLSEIRPQIREVVLQKRVDNLLDDWLKQIRAATRVEIADQNLTNGEQSR